MATYNASIPQPSNKLRNSQSDLLGNFTAINDFVSEDHVGFNVANIGKHNKVTFPVQAAAPAFAAGENGIYNKLFNTGTNPTNKNELYVHKQRNATTAEIPFTASSLSNTNPLTLGKGWSYLPSGFLFVWGIADITSSSVGITPQADSGCPNFNVVMQVLISPYSTLGVTAFSPVVQSIPVAPTGNFTVQASGQTANTKITYLVIGY